MTLEEYKEKMKILDEQYILNISDLKKQYAASNNPYKIGDIITDHYKTIKITSIGWYSGANEPECVYTGVRLNKDGTPAKDQSENKVYQSNIKKP